MGIYSVPKPGYHIWHSGLSNKHVMEPYGRDAIGWMSPSFSVGQGSCLEREHIVWGVCTLLGPTSVWLMYDTCMEPLRDCIKSMIKLVMSKGQCAVILTFPIHILYCLQRWVPIAIVSTFNTRGIMQVWNGKATPILRRSHIYHHYGYSYKLVYRYYRPGGADEKK